MNRDKSIKFFWVGFKNWTPLILAVTLIFGTFYLVAQQSFRLMADDQPAEVISNAGQTSGPVEIRTSSSLFTVIYDQSGNPVSGSGLLDGQLPEVPMGVLEYAKLNGENRVTWQPRPGLRFATVVAPIKTGTVSGYLLAAKSLRETEDRTDLLTKQVAIGLFTTVFLIFVYTLLVEYSRFK